MDEFIDNNQPMSTYYEVYCGHCHWWGRRDQLRPGYKSNPSSPTDVVLEPSCPRCLSDQWLEDSDSVEDVEIGV